MQAVGEVESPPLIETLGISKDYGHIRALVDVDFSLVAGEIQALVGDNGAGKSTLVKIISGAIQPTAGEILVEGTVHRFREPEDALRTGIATVYQNLALVDCRTIEDNLFLGREPTRLSFVKRRQMREESFRTLSSMQQMNILDTRVKVGDLSGGQRQSVAIARAMRLGSRVLILDEPTAALGVRESHQVLEIISDLKSETRAILIVSHNLAHVFRVADRITVIRGGRLIGTMPKANATPDDIVRMITGASAL